MAPQYIRVAVLSNTYYEEKCLKNWIQIRQKDTVNLFSDSKANLERVVEETSYKFQL